MGVGFFIYTVALLVVCVLAAAICLSAYFVSHRSVYLMGMALFLFYLFDLALIFQSEYLAQNLTFDQSLFYAIEHPSWKIAMSAGFLASMWLIVCSYLDEARMAVKAAPLVLYVVLCLGVLLLMPIGADQQFWFYTMRQVFMAGAAIYVMVRYRLSTDAVERTRMRRHRTLFAIICIFLACITIEDAINIYMPPLNLFGPDFPLYLSERNFSENILIVIIAAAAMKGAAQTLSCILKSRPTAKTNRCRSISTTCCPSTAATTV